MAVNAGDRVIIAVDELAQNSTPINMTNEAIDVYLGKLQDEEFKLRIPAVIFLAVLAVTGFCGNILVMMVYCPRSNLKPTRIFITAMAAYDLVANVLTIPGFIHNLVYTMQYPSATMCRGMVFVAAFTTISSTSVLCALAVSRYRLVCRPFGWQVTPNQAKITCGSIAIFCLVVSIPSGVTSGISLRPTPLPGVYGRGCAIDQALEYTIYPKLVNGFYFLLFLSLCIPMVTLYCLIGIQAYRHRHVHGLPSVKTKSSSSASLSQRSEDNTLERPSKRKPRFLKSSNRYDVHRKMTDADDKYKMVHYLNHDDGLHCVNTREDNNVKLIYSSTVERATNAVSKVEKHSEGLNNVRKVESTVSSGMQASCSSLSTSSKNLEGNSEKTGTDMIQVKVHLEHSGQSMGKRINISLDEIPQQSEIPCVFDKAAKKRIQSDLASQLHSIVMNSTDHSITRESNAAEKSSSKPSKKTKFPHGDLSHETNTSHDQPGGIFVEERINDALKMANCDDSDDKCNGTRITTTTKFFNDSNKILSNRTESNEMRVTGDNSIGTLYRSTTHHDNIVFQQGDHCSVVLNPRQLQIPKRRATINKMNRVTTMNRTTIMLIVITTVYLMAFVPYFVLSSYRLAWPAHYQAMGPVQASFFYLFLYTIFVNNAANSVIYSLCDPSFRHHVFQFLSCKKKS